MTKRLVVALVSLAAGVSLALAIPLANIVTRDQQSAFVSRLQVETLATASVLASQELGDWTTTVQQTAERTAARVVVVDRRLKLVADSDNSGLDRSFDRPEIEAALSGHLTSDVRASQTLGQALRYVAAPIVQDRKVVAAVRLSLPEDQVAQVVRTTQLWLGLFVTCVVLGSAVIAWFLARGVSSPLQRLSDLAHRLPDDLTLRADEASGPSEIRAVAESMNLMAERLGGLVERTERVAAEASHHLRTPLTGLRMRLEAIEETAGDPAVATEAARANEEVSRLARRIEQILALARSDARSTEPELVNASETVLDRIDAARAVAKERKIELIDDVTPELYARCLPGVVARSIDELLGNALMYAKSEIKVALVAVGENVRLSVADDGPGVPESELAELFVRFRRGAKSVAGGSGLGLAMVKESAVASGGDADAELLRGGGLRIRVWWPLDA